MLEGFLCGETLQKKRDADRIWETNKPILARVFFFLSFSFFFLELLGNYFATLTLSGAAGHADGESLNPVLEPAISSG